MPRRAPATPDTACATPPKDLHLPVVFDIWGTATIADTSGSDGKSSRLEGGLGLGGGEPPKLLRRERPGRERDALWERCDLPEDIDTCFLKSEQA
jgi:hypothetical protein